MNIGQKPQYIAGFGMPKRAHTQDLVRPQAALNNLRPTEAKGLGLSSEAARSSMVARLRVLGISHPLVLSALQSVPRHVFVDAAFASRAYEDTALPIGWGQTISMPYTVAHMVQSALGAQPQIATGAWLEVGTGCGYQAAIMAHCAPHIYSQERIAGLADKARANLDSIGLQRVQVRYNDGQLGWRHDAAASAMRFDAILSAAAGAEISTALQAQLTLGGRLLAPRHSAAGGQELVCIDRISETQFVETILGKAAFVPLLTGQA